jgi:hypothetical protein
MAHDVFISYSSRDKSAADAACHFLEADGIRCWIAPRDIPPGQSWKPHIVQAIRDARVMVLIFSGQANRSPQVKREVDIAFESGHPIVPFRIEDVQMDDEMYYCLAAAHWLDALSDPLENHLDRLLHAVRLLVDPPPGHGDVVVPGAAAPTAASVSPLPGASSARPAASPRAEAAPGRPPAPVRAGPRRWVVPAGVGGLLLVASVAFGLMTMGGDDPPTDADAGAEGGLAVAPDASQPSGAPSSEQTGGPTGAVSNELPSEPGSGIVGGTGGTGGTVEGGGTASGGANPPQSANAATTPANAPTAPPVATTAPANAATGVLVLIRGNEPGAAAEVETTVLRAMLQMPAITPIDASSLGLLRGQQGAVNAASQGDFSELATLALSHGAEFLVVGTLTADATPGVNQFFAGSAILDLKVYRVSTGSLLGAEVLRAGTAGNMAASADQARSRAAADVGRSAVATLRRWVSRVP